MQQTLPTSDPVFLIETDKIEVNPYQPRRNFDPDKLNELASSIRELGMLQPIVVSKIEEEGETGTLIRYELVAGERRLRAAKLLNMPRVPAVIKNVMLDQHKLEMSIVENVQRANLNPVESAKAYNRLQDEFGLTQREIAGRVGKSRESVANTMRLLNLPSEIQQALADGKLSESQARLLLSIEEISVQQKIFKDILYKNMSVRETKQRVDAYKREMRIPRKQTMLVSDDAEALNLQRSLEEFLGANVRLESKGKRGKITIPFHSIEELQGLVEKMTAQRAEQSIDELYEEAKEESADLSSDFGLDSSTQTQEEEEAAEEVSDEQLHPGQEHEGLLPAEQPEQEITEVEGDLDSRDTHDPFKFHGI